MSSEHAEAERWPGWAKAILIGQFAILLAILLPILLMCLTMAGWMGMGGGDMWQWMERMPRR